MTEYLPKNNPEHDNNREVKELYEIYGGNGNKLYPNTLVLDPELSPIDAQNWAIEKLAEAKLGGKLTGLVAGAFDVPQENHDWFLRHARYLLAKRYLQNGNLIIDTESIRDTIESDKIFLVVSIDSDISLDKRKSNDTSKGGVKRPIYGWLTRASRIASYNVVDRYDTRKRYGIADLVVAEGPDYDGTILQQAKIFADKMHNKSLGLLDEYIVFDEHQQDIENAIESGFDPLIISMELVYSVDPISGEPYKSSAIIKRIRGENSAE